MVDKLLYRDEVYAIQGALFDVYKAMGNMWGEEVYQQCLEKELALRKIPFRFLSSRDHRAIRALIRRRTPLASSREATNHVTLCLM